jgi:hypothetical protein
MAAGARLASALALVGALAAPAVAQPDDDAVPAPAAAPARRTSDDGAAIKAYYDALAGNRLLDVDAGDLATLRAEVGAAEELLRAGALIDAAVAFYGIVESPRYAGLDDAVEYQNAEYDLGVALARSGAYDSALDYLARAVSRGPASPYFGPAHRRAIDVALETNDHQGVLARLQAIQLEDPLPPEAIGERTYLQARAAYAAGDLVGAEAALSRISRKSRLYTSALYLRGVIQTRQGGIGDAAAALCEVVDQPDADTFTFVVDERYFTIKDLARLGLGRLAHEVGDYDDAYYHYFQIPDDSDRLPEALFEAAWSMYQKRELGTARDLAGELLKDFPAAPVAPEAGLLAGYVELADCKFEQAQKHYDGLVKTLAPVVAELEVIRKDPGRRAGLYDRALRRWRAEKASPDQRLDLAVKTPADQVLAFLRVDPRFVRLHDAMSGLGRAQGDARLAARAWAGLGARLATSDVKGVAKVSPEAEDADAAARLADDVRALGEQIGRAQAELRAAERSGTIDRGDAAPQAEELAAMAREALALGERANDAAANAAAAVTDDAAPGVGKLIAADQREARGLEGDAAKLARSLAATADAIAKRSLDDLHAELKRALDKARLGKIDAVIGQKRRLEIEVQDLAAGRFPAELHGLLWEQGLIGDDEEFWPFEGEWWADEYEGWR